MNLVTAIRYNLANISRFNGRESRQTFWLWIAAVIGFSVVAGFAIFVPAMISSISKMQRFAADHPEQTTITEGPGRYSVEIHGSHPELMPDFGGLIASLATVYILSLVLLAAAVARRLHDCGRSGWWGLMPVPFLTAGVFLFEMLLGPMAAKGSGIAPDASFFRLFGLLFANNLIYLATLVTLVVMLCRASDPGPNRFGSGPIA